MIKLQNKTVAIIGFGRSGQAAAFQLVKIGAKLLVSDEKAEDCFDGQLVKELKNKGVNFDFNNHNNCELILLAEIIIVSPGVHLDLPILAKAREKGIPVISEVELAYQILNKPMVAVTGTNGKTTTTTLIAEMINQSDKKAIAAGNIGLALVSVDDEHLDYVIAEVSSYQLETIREFKPWISIILNIQPDHLERHGDMENYISQKSRIFINQTIEDFLVYNLDDEQVVKMASSAKCRKIGFTKKNTEILGLLPHEIRIPGEHNIENCLAAATAASLCGVKRETIAKVLKEFPGVEHRIELCGEKQGIKFYNDSKATNPDSTMVAINSFPGQGIILLLGGRDKGTDLGPMCKLIKQKVKSVILMGEAKERFKSALLEHGFSDISDVNDFTAGFGLAVKLAKKGDVILLSPACASFDMFSNFEERGRVFKKLVSEYVNAAR